jgi:hypothetical protein
MKWVVAVVPCALPSDGIMVAAGRPWNAREGV